MKTIASTRRGFRTVEIHAHPRSDPGITFSPNVEPSTRQGLLSAVEQYLETYSLLGTGIGDSLLEHGGFFVEILPADQRVSGLSMSLAVLASILAAESGAERSQLLLLGCLSPQKGFYPGSEDARALEQAEEGVIVVPSSGSDDIRVGRNIVTVETIADLWDLVRSPRSYVSQGTVFNSPHGEEDNAVGSFVDFGDIIGQDVARWWAFICAAGRHHLMLVGPPGQGKSMISKALPTILPPLSGEEHREVDHVYQMSGISRPDPNARPFWSVGGKGIPPSALFGGGSETIQPGAVSLAHLGLLHIDEFLELSPARIESLRTVMEDRVSPIVRTNFKLTLPADFQLVATANRCPCGNLGNPDSRCRCHPAQVRRYQGRMSAAIADRIDVIIRTGVGDVSQLLSPNDNPMTSRSLRPSIYRAWKSQNERYDSHLMWNSNAPAPVAQRLPMTENARDLLMQVKGVSFRGITKSIRLARTITDVYEGPEGPIKSGAIRASLRAVGQCI